MAGEFSLIDQYFKLPVVNRTVGVNQVFLGIGDDCALLDVPAGTRLAVSKDMLIEHRHFFADVDPQSLGHKTLAVNLSDLAAMGATPLGCFLGLGLPKVNDQWLSAFAKGFHALSQASNCPLLGGDTVQTPHDISLSVTVLGYVPREQPALVRHAAKLADDIWVSGELGAADLAYRIRADQLPQYKFLAGQVNAALDWPTPRLALGQALLGVAHAAIDISDGLLQDLNHILQASHVGARLYEPLLPIAPTLLEVSADIRQNAVLSGGEAYELCFTAPITMRAQIQNIALQINVPLTRVGQIVDTPGISVFDQSHHLIVQKAMGFEHFSN